MPVPYYAAMVLINILMIAIGHKKRFYDFTGSGEKVVSFHGLVHQTIDGDESFGSFSLMSLSVDITPGAFVVTANLNNGVSVVFALGGPGFTVRTIVGKDNNPDLDEDVYYFNTDEYGKTLGYDVSREHNVLQHGELMKHALKAVVTFFEENGLHSQLVAQLDADESDSTIFGSRTYLKQTCADIQRLI